MSNWPIVPASGSVYSWHETFREPDQIPPFLLQAPTILDQRVGTLSPQRESTYAEAVSVIALPIDLVVAVKVALSTPFRMILNIGLCLVDQARTPNEANIALAHWARFNAQIPVLTAMPEAECSTLGRNVT